MNKHAITFHIEKIDALMERIKRDSQTISIEIENIKTELGK